MMPADSEPDDTHPTAQDEAAPARFGQGFRQRNIRQQRVGRVGVERVAAALHQQRLIYSGDQQASDMLRQHDLSDCLAQPLGAKLLKNWRKADGSFLFDRRITALDGGVYRHSSGLCFTVSTAADPGTDTQTLLVTFGGTSAGRFKHPSTLVRSILNMSDTARQWWHNVRAHRGHNTAISNAGLEILESARRFALQRSDLVSNVTASGHSLGAGVAYRAAAALYTPDNPINTLLFDCPPTSLSPESRRRLEGFAVAQHTTRDTILRDHNVHVYGRNDVVVKPAPFMAANVAPVVAASFPIDTPPGVSGIRAHNRFDHVVLQTDNTSSLPMFERVGRVVTQERRRQRNGLGASSPVARNGQPSDVASRRFWASAAQSGRVAPGAAHAAATSGANKGLRLG